MEVITQTPTYGLHLD